MKILKLCKTGTMRQHYDVVVDEIPKLTYEKIGSDYVGSAALESGEIIFSEHLRWRSWNDAFGGRTLYLPMKDGSIQEIQGHWWDDGPYAAHGEFVNIGLRTVDELRDCFVFCSYNIQVDTFNAMLAEYYERDRNYEYSEVRKWAELQFNWHPVIIDGKPQPLLINQRGYFIDPETKERVYCQRRVCKIRKQKCFHLHFFEWNRMVDGRKIRMERKLRDVFEASLPPEEFEIAKKVWEM